MPHYKDIVDNILPAHMLLGCDTLSFMWGIEKETVLKVLKSGEEFQKSGYRT